MIKPPQIHRSTRKITLGMGVILFISAWASPPARAERLVTPDPSGVMPTAYANPMAPGVRKAINKMRKTKLNQMNAVDVRSMAASSHRSGALRETGGDVVSAVPQVLPARSTPSPVMRLATSTDNMTKRFLDFSAPSVVGAGVDPVKSALSSPRAQAPAVERVQRKPQHPALEAYEKAHPVGTIVVTSRDFVKSSDSTKPPAPKINSNPW